MKVFKKKLVQRLSCVCCAVAFAIFSVFSICDFSRSKKSEVISASAEESTSSYYYKVTIPAGTVLTHKFGDFSLTGATGIALPFFSYSTTSSSSIDTNLSIARDFIFLYKEGQTSLAAYTICPSPKILYTFDSSDYMHFTLAEDCILYFDNSYAFEILSFTDNVAVIDGTGAKGVWFGFIVMFSNREYGYYTVTLYENPLTCYRYPTVTLDDLSTAYDDGYNNGFDDGYNIGYEHGYSTGVQDTRDEAFNDGYNVGKEDGKDEALEINKRGLFSSFSSIEVYAYDLSDNYLFSAEADYGVNAVSFGSAVETLERWNYENQVSPAYYKVMFVTGHGYEHEIPIEMLEILAYGDSSIFGRENSFIGQGSDYYTQTWRGYPMYFDTSQEGDGYPLVIEYNDIDPHLSRARLNNFAVTVPNLSLLRNLQFVATSGYYSQGYSQGVADGYQNGLTDGEKVGYNKGYEYGENVGYNRGVGDSGEYTFLGLFTAVVDAPIKAFLGLLDFEILGMDMQKFFLSILTAALCIAVYRLFSGSAT